jgi:hypothetical protein
MALVTTDKSQKAGAIASILSRSPRRADCLKQIDYPFWDPLSVACNLFYLILADRRKPGWWPTP